MKGSPHGMSSKKLGMWLFLISDRRVLKIWVGLLLFPISTAITFAQCVMCARTASAQNLERVAVLNQGILILLVPPIAGLLAILTMAWRRR